MSQRRFAIRLSTLYYSFSHAYSRSKSARRLVTANYWFGLSVYWNQGTEACLLVTQRRERRNEVVVIDFLTYLALLRCKSSVFTPHLRVPHFADLFVDPIVSKRFHVTLVLVKLEVLFELSLVL